MRKIKHLKHNEIDKNRWDTCLSECSNALIYANSFYLDIVSPNWEAFATEDYSYLFPLPVKQKFGIKYITHPLFAQQLGLFFKEKDPAIISEFVRLFSSKYRRHLLRMNSANDDINNIQSNRSNFILPITSEDKMQALLNQGTKRNLKKAKQYKLQFTESISSNEFIQLKKETSRAVLKEPEWNRMQQLIDALMSNKMGFYIGVLNNDSLVSAVFFTKWKNRICYLFSASNEDGLERRGSFIIVEKVIQDHLNSHMILDFEGSMDENIARFFKGFGAREEVYFEIKRSF